MKVNISSVGNLIFKILSTLIAFCLFQCQVLSMSVMEYNFAILTVSDRCSSQEAVDESGIFLVETIKTFSDEKSQFNVVDYCIVPDEEQSIKNVLFKHCNIDLLDCVITTGGTGFTARDITPEATKAIIEKDAPGIAHALFAASLKATPMAMLSRFVIAKCFIYLAIHILFSITSDWWQEFATRH